MYDAHRWFDLRDAVRGKNVPPLYLGAVAAAFNNVEDAEKYLNRAIRHASTPEEANEAREVLANLYMLHGRRREAVRQFDEILRAKPGRPDVQNARAILSALGRNQDQSIVYRHRASFGCMVSDRGFIMPLSINGKTVNWSLDTGFNFTSSASESEARMLGLTIQDASALAEDLAGGSIGVRTATAERLVIGGMEIRNVPMLVFPDSQPPWNSLPPGKRGAVGLPIAIALQTLRWTANGRCESSIPTKTKRNGSGEMNLCFDGLTPLTRVQFGDKLLDFILDTGNQAGTQLWARFAEDFAALVREGGSKGTKRITQIGGGNDREIVILPEVRFRVGGLETALRPANIFSKPVGNDLQHGNLGLDVLTQANEVSIDFRSMSIALH